MRLLCLSILETLYDNKKVSYRGLQDQPLHASVDNDAHLPRNAAYRHPHQSNHSPPHNLTPVNINPDL